MTDAFHTLARPSAGRVTRSRSRFLAYAFPVSSADEADAHLERLHREHRDASHVCFAYRLCSGDETIEVADDAGEPAGSAGPPILRRLEGADLHDVLVVVVRYFGGTKLGIGGLIRAYGDATAEALASARVVVRRLEVEVDVTFPPEITSGVMAVIHRHRAKIRHIEYDASGTALVALPPSRVATFVDALREVTGARATAEVRS